MNESNEIINKLERRTNMNNCEYMSKEIIKKLMGWQIVGAALSEDKESFGFIVSRDPHGEKVQRQTVWVDCDPEGNGPGWLSVEGEGA